MNSLGIKYWGVTSDLKLMTGGALRRLPSCPISAVVCLIPYYTGECLTRNLSYYCSIPDYHIVAVEMLEKICEKLRQRYPENYFIAFADTSPIDEVAAGITCGLGNLGKNGLLINKEYGALCFIASIVTDRKFPDKIRTGNNGCINCLKCLSDCPTGAISEKGFERENCLSLVTQKKKDLTENQRVLIKKAGLVWGCDCCSLACPIKPKITPIKEFYQNVMPVVNEKNLDILMRNRAFNYRGRKVIERNMSIFNPLLDSVQRYNNQNNIRFHTPGHKGNLPYPLSEVAPYDVTELPITGSLFDGDGIFYQIEKSISRFYGTGHSLISAGGATLCIQTMLATFCEVGSQVIISRGCHRSVISSCAMLDLDAIWVYPDIQSEIGTVSATAIKNTLESYPTAKTVIVTSPDYFGVMADIKEISRVCNRYGAKLLVDNSHGSHLKFFNGLHPIELGAEACCDSFHKTLPVMTGGAILHIKDESYINKARCMMSLFGSTSPSYPIMISIDLVASNLPILAEQYREYSKEISALKEKAEIKAVRDPMRLCVCLPPDFDSVCQNLKIQPEYVTNQYAVFLISPLTPLHALEKLVDICPKPSNMMSLTNIAPLEKVVSIRKAVFSEKIQLDIDLCEDMVSAEIFSPCPPGIPIVIPGEKISLDTKNLLKNYGANKLFVVKYM